MCRICRVGAELPEGVTPHPNGTLAFRRPLTPSDAGTYRCVAKNDVGEASAVVEISLTGKMTALSTLARPEKTRISS